MHRRNKIRITVLLVVAALFSGSLAKADPLSDLQKLLLPVKDVTATGYSPTRILVSWVDRSAVETSFRIEMAIENERSTYHVVGWAGKCDNGGLSPTTDLSLVLPRSCSATIDLAGRNDIIQPADPRALFFRVVPVIEIPNDINAPAPGQGTPVLEGAPSIVDPAMLGPLAPTDLLCNGGGEDACVNVTSVTLTWTDNATTESFYWIYRARGAGNVDFGTEPHAAAPPDATSFHEDLQDYGKVFTYKVTAVREYDIERADGSVGRSDRGEPTERSYSDSAEVPTGATSKSPPTVIIVPVAPVPAPTDPSGLTAVFVFPGTDPKCPSTRLGCTRLTWVDSSVPGASYVDEDGWFIEIGPTSNGVDFESQWTAPGTPGAGARTYYDTTMTPDTKRCYRVRAWRLGPAYSAFTNSVCIGALPKGPSDLTAIARSNATVDLAWKDNSTTEESFVVERRCNVGLCPSGTLGVWVEIANDLPVNTQRFTDSNTLSLTNYSYRVFAKNSTGRSAASNIATITTLPAPVVKPTSLTAVGLSRAIQLSWIDNAADETGYLVEYRHALSCSLPQDDWRSLTELPANTQGYIDSDGLGLKQSRIYRVRAMKGKGVSDPSNEACATTLDKQLPNGAPKDVRATTKSNTTILLEWTDTASNETAFRIEYAVGTNAHCGSVSPLGLTWRLYKNVQPLNPQTNRPWDLNGTGARSWLVDGLTPHSAYFFRVKAVNPDGESDWGLRQGVTADSGDPLDVVTTCAQTFGPPRPAFIDPSQDNQINATRCDFTVRAFRWEADNTTPHHDRAGAMKVDIISSIPGSSIAHRDTLYVIANGGTLPGSVNNKDKGEYIITEYNSATPNNPDMFKFGTDKNNWTVPYGFHRGFNYKILVTSYLEAAPHWTSTQVHVTDVKVAADCPLPNIVGNRPR